MSEAPPAAPADRVADRYGTRPRRHRRWIPYALGAAVVLAGLIVSYAGYSKFGPKDIEPEQLGYSIVNDSTLDVHFKVTREHPDRPVVCFVRGMDSDQAEVGRREVLIPASTSGTVELTTTVRTTGRPAAGDIYGCSDKVPAYLRVGGR
ncbi:hypothetical protein BJY24_001484 [Nocardia transvalensis]|uniref:DUF4307 domain-containing protein n=1 Tax=Nocardia transvalensis TaxID=37333 RepID=A0A7W9UH01_9NOCA|nr:DUF4307 domain-containing protein [Nocardia transvalensis]MBB5912617.1 hypothetical protein [Nocardia transvalensis]